MFPCPRSRPRIWFLERDPVVPSRVSPLIFRLQANRIINHQSSIINHQSGAYSRDSSSFPRRRPHIPSTAIGSVPSLSGRTNAYRWRSLPRVRRHRASSPQGGSSNGCCLLSFHHGPTFMCVLCFLPIHSGHQVRWTYQPGSHRRKVTQEEGHTGFLIHLPSAVRALIFVARRIQPFLSLVDREVEFCVLTN